MSNHICPKCETAVIAAWRQELDGNYYHDKCLPFRGLLNHAESELIAANARIAELEQEKADTVLRMTTWAANTLHTCHEQCERPLCVANRRIAALEALLGEAIESIEDWAGYASEYFREKYGLAEELAKFRAALGEP